MPLRKELDGNNLNALDRLPGETVEAWEKRKGKIAPEDGQVVEVVIDHEAVLKRLENL